MSCKTCKFLLDKNHISYSAQLIGYIGECSKSGILFKEIPEECMLAENKEGKLK